MRFPSAFLVLALLTLAFAGCLNEATLSEDSAEGKVRRAGTISGGLGDIPTFFAAYADGTIPDPDVISDLIPLAGESRYIGGATFEPTIGSDAKGNLFMVQFGGGAHIVGSFDQGASWKRVNPNLVPVDNPTNGQSVNNPPNSNDPFVYVDKGTGRIFQADLQALVCNWLQWSDDLGATWTTNPIGCGHPFGVHDHQSVAVGRARNLPSTWAGRVVYYCVNRVGDSSCATSLNGGLSFGPLVPVMIGTDPAQFTQTLDINRGGVCGGLTGHVKTDNEGRAFLGKNNNCGVPTVAFTEDDGVTWTPVVVSRSEGISGHDVEIGTDEKGNVYAFWLNERSLPVLSISKDHGRTWSPAMPVAAPGITVAKFNAVFAAGEGRVAFTYMGNTVSGGAAASAENYTNSMWHAYIGVITNALDENPLVMTTMVDSPQDPVAIGRCGGRCPGAAGNGMGDFMDITIDNQGRPWAALVDVCHRSCMENFTANATNARNEREQGFAGTLASGPSLLTDGGALAALPALIQDNKPK